MSLSREPLPLEPSPRSVQRARHWTSEVVVGMGRADLRESAELGVSELVTNALLHAEPPLSVRVRGTREHPRVEVADGSPEPPVPPEASIDLAVEPGAGTTEADLDVEEALSLSTLGRGLGIVSMCASAWGADILRDGKVVWFEPVGKDAAGEPSPAAIFTRVDDLARTVPEEPLSPVLLEGVPLTLYAGFRQHFRELRRELRLLALAHESDYPLAANLGTLLADFEAHLRHAETDEAAARRAHDPEATTPSRVDLPIQVPRSTPEFVAQMLDLLDLADAFCQAERLLSLARTPAQRQFQRWFLSELVRQAEGESPTAWRDTDTSVDQNAS